LGKKPDHQAKSQYSRKKARLGQSPKPLKEKGYGVMFGKYAKKRKKALVLQNEA